MSEPTAENVLRRVLCYLQRAGVTLDSAVEQQALRLVAGAMALAPDDVMGACIRLLPDYFELPVGHVPPLAPPLQRGSLGYGDY